MSGEKGLPFKPPARARYSSAKCLLAGDQLFLLIGVDFLHLADATSEEEILVGYPTDDALPIQVQALKVAQGRAKLHRKMAPILWRLYD